MGWYAGGEEEKESSAVESDNLGDEGRVEFF